MAVVIAACYHNSDVYIPVSDCQVEAQFSVPADATRTMIAEDGRSTYWAIGDKIALWAKDSAGNFVVDAATFMMHHYSTEYSKTYFAGNINELPEDRYTYYMCSPLPHSKSGTQVTYNLPAIQNGTYASNYDIMVARSVEAGSITAPEKIDLNTSFIHQMHALKITIPEGRNDYVENSSTKFYSLEITFPTAVVGDITFDVTNPDAAPTYSNTSNTITLYNEAGFDAGSDIWVFVLPGTVDGDVSYYVRGERRKSNVATYGLSREFKRGSITPIRMHIPEIYPLYTALHFCVDQNNLGEDFTFFDVYDVNGNHMGRFERNAANKYTVDYEGEFDADVYDNSSWRIVFDSPHAIVETTVAIGDLTSYQQHTRWMNVPYLLYENFSSVDDYTDEATTGTKTLSIAGWTASRTNCKGGVIQLATFYAVIGRYQGRLDSAPISTIKDEANIKVTFNANNNINKKVAVPLQFGWGTDSNAIEAGTAISSLVTTTTLAKGDNKTLTYTINNFPSNGRLAWQTNVTSGLWATYNYLGIDDVRVQVAP